MPQPIIRSLFLVGLAIMLPAAGAAATQDLTIEMGAPVSGATNGGSVSVTSPKALSSGACMGRGFVTTVDADDPAFFTANSPQLETLADTIGAAIVRICTQTRGRPLRLEFRDLADDGSVLASAFWVSVKGSEEGRITIFREPGKRDVLLPPDENSNVLDLPYMNYRYPFILTSEVVRVDRQLDSPLLRVAKDIAALPDERLMDAFEVALVADSLYRFCGWSDAFGFSRSQADGAFELLSVLLKMDTVESGRTGPYLKEAAARLAQSEDSDGEIVQMYATAMQNWNGDVRLAANNVVADDESVCTVEDVTADGQEAMKLLVMSDRNLLIDAIKAGKFAQFEALASFIPE
ncbi:MAG: hypothetical protein AAFX52_02695 [Pseudomonadota bacterium]